MAIKLNCIHCGRTFDLGDAYEDYEGEIRCWVCSTTLVVTLAEGRLKKMVLPAARSEHAASAQPDKAPVP